MGSKELGEAQNDASQKGADETPKTPNNHHTKSDNKILGTRMGIESESHTDEDPCHPSGSHGYSHSIGINVFRIDPH